MERAIGLFHDRRQSSPESETASGTIAEDVRLVEAAKSGDRAAFGRLYSNFSPMVYGILLSHVSRRDAEDLVHDVFLVALRQLHTLRKVAAFPGWLAMIARNRARDHYRRRREVEELSESMAASDDHAGEAGAVLAVIRSLPEAYRETLVLRLVEGMTGNEIAARTGLTPASVRVNLHRGMKQLRERLSGSNSHE